MPVKSSLDDHDIATPRESRLSAVNPCWGSCGRTDSHFVDDLFQPRTKPRIATTRAYGRGQAAHGPISIGSAACLVRFAYGLRGCATTAASPLRRHAQADAYRGPLDLAPLSLPRGLEGFV